MEDLLKVFSEIQTSLKVEKKRRNEHMGYHYRNAEDILAGLKPHLKKYGLVLNISHELKESAGMAFLQVNVGIQRGSEKIENSYVCPILFPSEKLNPTMVFGGTVSYANKYALSSMFLLDDGNDQDSMEPRTWAPQQQERAAVPRQIGRPYA